MLGRLRGGARERWILRGKRYRVNRRPLGERKRVGALGHLDNDRVAGSFGRIIFGKFGAKASGLDANHGIYVWIEVFIAPENFRRNLILLRSGARVLQRMIREITQQVAQRLGAVQSTTLQYAVNLIEVLAFAVHGTLARIVTSR